MRGFSLGLVTGCLSMALSCLAGTAAGARPKPLDGPIPAFVEQVLDGDTVAVRARIWLGQELQVMVRLRGVDAPEIKGRCDAELHQAQQAKEFLQQSIGQRKVFLRDISEDKYAGRVIADVTDEAGASLSAKLLSAKLARPYEGRRRAGWCDAGATPPAAAAAARADETAPEPGALRASFNALRALVGKRPAADGK
jgi:micrococcal nuclease